MKHYAIAELPVGSRFSPEERMTVLAFASRVERDAWVSQPEPRERRLRTYGEKRRAISRDEASEAMAAIECAVHGGQPSRRLGYAALAVMGCE